MTPEEKNEMTASTIIAFLVGAATIAAATLIGCPHAHGDYIAAFHSASCLPCKQQEPVEARAKSRGVDLRVYDVAQWPQGAAYYRVRVVPTYVYVVERDGRAYATPWRIEGAASAAQIHRLATMPAVTTAGAATRGVVRSIVWPLVPVVEVEP